MATRRDLLTKDAQAQMQMLIMGASTGVIDPASAMQGLMGIASDPSYSIKGKTDIEKQKERERIIADLQLAEMMGDIAKAREIKMKMLGKERSNELKQVANYKFSPTEKIAGLFAGAKDGLGGMYKGYKNPGRYNIMMAENNTGRSGLDPRSTLDALKFLGKQNLGFGEQSDYAYSPDTMNLANMYLAPKIEGGWSVPGEYDSPLSSYYGEPNSYLQQ